MRSVEDIAKDIEDMVDKAGRGHAPPDLMQTNVLLAEFAAALAQHVAELKAGRATPGANDPYPDRPVAVPTHPPPETELQRLRAENAELVKLNMELTDATRWHRHDEVPREGTKFAIGRLEKTTWFPVDVRELSWRKCEWAYLPAEPEATR